MKRLRMGMLALLFGLTLYPFANLQSEVEMDCAEGISPEPATQTIIDKLSTIVAFDRDANNFSFVGLGKDTDIETKSNELPYSYRNVLQVDGPYLSSDGSRIMALYGTYDVVEFVLIVNLVTGHTRTFGLEQTYSKWKPNLTWANESSIAVSKYDRATNLFQSFVFDADSGNHFSVTTRFTGETPTPRYAPIFSPDLRHIAYVGVTKNDDEALVVFDLKSRSNTIVKITSHIGYLGYFSWSPDGDYLAVVMNPDPYNHYPRNFQILDVSGQVVAESNLVYPDSYDGDDIPSHYKWSPIGDKFLFQTGEFEFEDKLVPFTYILSVNDGSVIETCVPGKSFWSSDGTLIASFILVEPTANMSGYVARIFVFDTISNRLYEVQEFDSDPIGLIIGWGA